MFSFAIAAGILCFIVYLLEMAFKSVASGISSSIKKYGQDGDENQ
ncbi:hypothetical protein [Pectobacterium wasabiae]|nr:hypothetical protein [Pectobacterium wasabiae]EJS92735.1 Hypothetical protein Y17_4183 [Pectobacterium wasabiae CFBP 3304]